MRILLRHGCIALGCVTAASAGGLSAQDFALGPAAAVSRDGPANSARDLDPKVDTDGEGKWVVVWSSNNDLGGPIEGDSDILSARLLSDGSWTDPIPVNNNAGSDTGDDTKPTIRSAGEGRWVAVWLSEDSLDNSIETDVDILTAHSTDDGRTWSDPFTVNDAADDGDEELLGEFIRTSSGALFVQWLRRDHLTDEFIDMFSATSIDGGQTWSPPRAHNFRTLLPPEADLRFGFPGGTTDGEGRWVASWRDGLAIVIALSADDGASWSAAQPWAGESQLTSWGVATDTLGTWLRFYVVSIPQAGPGSGSVLGGSTDNGSTWNGFTNPFSPPFGRIIAGLRHDGADAWFMRTLGFVIFQSSGFQRSTDGGETWQSISVPNAGFPSSLYSIRGDTAGNTILVWASTEEVDETVGSDSDILFATNVGFAPPSALASGWTMYP